MKSLLIFGLVLSAFGQALLALVNLGLVRILRWEKELERMPALMRDVFVVHGWFISVTLAIFAALTARFYQEMVAGSEPIYHWVAASIGGFWMIRAVIQVVYYSSAHWRGNLGRTVIHCIVLSIYLLWAALYLAVAFLPQGYR